MDDKIECNIKVKTDLLDSIPNTFKFKETDESSPSPCKSDITETSPISRRYKQCYRVEWESMPDFKGWLKGVPDEPTRAYCKVCNKSLHAHRLSLLKHMCTLKHTKAAQTAFAVQNAKQETKIDVLKEPRDTEKDMAEKEQTQPEIESHLEEEAVDDVSEIAPVDEPEAQDDDAPPSSKIARMEVAPTVTTVVPTVTTVVPSPLSTHVLDTAKGNPVGGMQVSLYRLIDGRWTHLSDGYTDPDGRCTDFIQKSDFTAGRYKLHFDVDRYFELRRQDSLYPFIEIVFDVKSPQEHYHVPLLLSPFGYTTYRGS